MLEELREYEGQQVPRWPTFGQQAKNLAKGLSGCDFFGYNVTFDMGCLDAGIKRANVPWPHTDAILLDPFALWKKLSKRTNSDFVREFAGREPTGAHRALNDIQDTIDGFFGFAQRFKLPQKVCDCVTFGDEPRDPNWIDTEGKFTFDDKGVPLCNFGNKWRGPTDVEGVKRVLQVDA
jgi:hypothetical protein